MDIYVYHKQLKLLKSQIKPVVYIRQNELIILFRLLQDEIEKSSMRPLL